MDIFRVATAKDADSIYAFTRKADSGLTTVPRTRESVMADIQLTDDFLNGDSEANRLLFVVERDGDILGISGIIPTLGLERTFYSFKLSRHARRSAAHDLSVKYNTLQLTSDFDGFTELASLYLSEEARGKGVGRLLSLGRLAFIHTHAEMFHERLMADIRGYSDSDGQSPFWEHLTSKFIQTEFDVADRLSATDGRFIIELLPSLPILLNLLPDIVNECAGKPHDLSASALNMLMGAGFEKTDLCDIFDGGPSIQCKTASTLVARSACTVASFRCETSETLGLNFGGRGKAFRAILGPVDIPQKHGTVGADIILPKESYLALANDRRQKARS